ncbi:MAG: hypothetical protein IT370_09380 [Deltaproteobacteria bacterium]|nr:hypothetical protein [Deltaproteobacteria bacterium]
MSTSAPAPAADFADDPPPPLPRRHVALSIRLDPADLARAQVVARRLGVSTARVLLGLVVKGLPAAEADPGALLVADAPAELVR